MSFLVSEMSFMILEMSFPILAEMSFGQNAQKKSLHGFTYGTTLDVSCQDYRLSTEIPLTIHVTPKAEKDAQLKR